MLDLIQLMFLGVFAMIWISRVFIGLANVAFAMQKKMLFFVLVFVPDLCSGKVSFSLLLAFQFTEVLEHWDKSITYAKIFVLICV